MMVFRYPVWKNRGMPAAQNTNARPNETHRNAGYTKDSVPRAELRHSETINNVASPSWIRKGRIVTIENGAYVVFARRAGSICRVGQILSIKFIVGAISESSQFFNIQTMMAFCTWRRFSASWKMTSAWASRVSLVISLPR